MNKRRRAELDRIRKEVSDAKAIIEADLEKFSSVLDQAKLDLESVKGDEESAYESLPESMQNGSKGEVMQTAIDAMSEAYDKLEEITGAITQMKDDIDEVDTKLEEAQA